MKEKIDERIEEMSKRHAQFEKWYEMRRDAKRRQRADRRLNLFRRKNNCFHKQFEGEEDTPDAEETLDSGEASATRRHVKGGEKTGPSASPLPSEDDIRERTVVQMGSFH